MTPQEVIRKLEQSFPRSSFFVEQRFKSVAGNEARYRKTEWSVTITDPDICVFALGLDEAVEELLARAKEVENASS